MAQELYESCASSTLHVGRKWQPRKKWSVWSVIFQWSLPSCLSIFQLPTSPHSSPPPICLKSVFYPSIFPATDEIVMHEFLYGAQWIYWLYPNVFTEPEDWSIYLLLCSWHMACLSFAITASHFVRSPRQSNQVFLRFISLYRITLKVAVDELTHKKGLTAMLNIYVYVFFCPDPEF